MTENLNHKWTLQKLGPQSCACRWSYFSQGRRHRGGGIGAAGAAMPPHFLAQTWATPDDHALIDDVAANDSYRGTGMLINTFENSEHAYVKIMNIN